MPRGGRRVGAGRKPKSKGVVLSMDGSRRADPEPQMPMGPPPAAAAPADGPDLSVPPGDLTPGQQEFWRVYAPSAIEQRTLVPATVIGFRELCEQFALKQTITKRLEKLGPASNRAAGQMRTYVKLAQRIDATLARFKLTGMGKPADTGGAKRPAANPWAQVATR